MTRFLKGNDIFSLEYEYDVLTESSFQVIVLT